MSPATADLAGVIDHAVTQVHRDGATMLPEPVAKEILRRAGIGVPRGTVAHSVDELVACSADVAGPWVLKAISPTLVHKSELGAVHVGITDRAELVAAAEEMRLRLEAANHEVSGFLLEELASAGVEVVVGAVRRPGVGPVVMVGLGGVLVEAMGDVAVRIPPLARHDVHAMLQELRGRVLLEGGRGATPVDIEALADVVLALAGPGGLLDQLPSEINELDLNPVLVGNHGAVAVDARFIVGGESSTPAALPTSVTGPAFDRLFRPRSIAVAGASARGENAANLFIRNLKSFGYTGEIHPVHLEADSVEDLPAVRAFSDLPAPVDYAYVALPGTAVPDLLASAAGRVAFAQVVSSGFGESEAGTDLERRLVSAARVGGVRLLGPNCIGTHCPAGRLTFLDDAVPEPGKVSVLSQSGGLSIDVLRMGAHRGLRFNKVVSMGNSVDVGPDELVRHLLDDPDTSVIALYLESLASGMAVLDVLRSRPTSKPVVLLAGGRTSAGARAAASHTGALLTDHKLWPVLARQAGAVLVDTAAELLDVLVAFQNRDPTVAATERGVVLFGNGGGTSVLACDALDRAELALTTFSPELRQRLEAIGLPAGTSVANPIDAPAPAIAVQDGKAAEAVLCEVLGDSEPPAAVLVHLNVGVIVSHTRQSTGDAVSSIITAIARARDSARNRAHIALALRTDGRDSTRERISDYRGHAERLGFAVYDEIMPAANALSALVQYDRQQAREGTTR